MMSDPCSQEKSPKRTVQNEHKPLLERRQHGRVRRQTLEARLGGEALPIEQSGDEGRPRIPLRGRAGQHQHFARRRDDSALLRDFAGGVRIVARDDLHAIAVLEQRLDGGPRRRLQRTVEQEKPAERESRLDRGARHRLQLLLTRPPRPYVVLRHRLRQVLPGHRQHALALQRVVLVHRLVERRHFAQQRAQRLRRALHQHASPQRRPQSLPQAPRALRSTHHRHAPLGALEAEPKHRRQAARAAAAQPLRRRQRPRRRELPAAALQRGQLHLVAEQLRRRRRPGVPFR